jgi:hypothetical protein
MDDQVKSVRMTLPEGSADYIVISALLDQMEVQWDMAKDAMEEKKAKLGKVCQRASNQIHIVKFHQKREQDRVGGDVIRRASMPGMKRKRALSDDGETDTEPTPGPSTDSSQSLSG